MHPAVCRNQCHQLVCRVCVCAVCCVCLSVQHHCRFCGKIFCGKCTSVELPSTRQGFVDPVRLCKGCIPVVKKDNEFMASSFRCL